jgi:hypothetical protein
MNKACEQTDPIERMKYVTTFLIAGLHTNPLICKLKGPLNPILGETYQAVKDDGTQIFLEQTSHHPPVSNFHMKGPNKEYEIFGFAVCNAELNGINSIRGFREGKNIIKFKDGTLMTYTLPEMRINGIVLGEKTLNFSGQFVIKDYQNKIESIVTFPWRVIIIFKYCRIYQKWNQLLVRSLVSLSQKQKKLLLINLSSKFLN